MLLESLRTLEKTKGGERKDAPAVPKHLFLAASPPITMRSSNVFACITIPGKNTNMSMHPHDSSGVYNL